MIVELLRFLCSDVGQASVARVGYSELQIRVPQYHIPQVEDWLIYHRPIGLLCVVKPMLIWEEANLKRVVFIDRTVTRKRT